MMQWSKMDWGRLAWNIRRIFQRIGWHSCVGITFLVISICIAGLAWYPGIQEIKDIRENADSLRMHTAQKQAMEIRSDPAMQLAEFYKLFPASDSMIDTLARIYDVASKNNLIIDQAEYKLSAMTAGHLQRYEISLPIRGRYVQVRNFVSELLATNNNLALTGIGFTRSSSTDIGVEAHLHLTLYVQEGS